MTINYFRCPMSILQFIYLHIPKRINFVTSSRSIENHLLHLAPFLENPTAQCVAGTLDSTVEAAVRVQFRLEHAHATGWDLLCVLGSFSSNYIGFQDPFSVQHFFGLC